MGSGAGTPVILGELFNKLFSCFLRQPAACASCMFTLQFPAHSSGQEGIWRSSEEDFWRTSLWWGDPPVARAVERESESSPLLEILFGGGWCFQERSAHLHMRSCSPVPWTFPYSGSLGAFLFYHRGNKWTHFWLCKDALSPLCSCCPIWHQEKYLSHQVHQSRISGGWGFAGAISGRTELITIWQCLRFELASGEGMV